MKVTLIGGASSYSPELVDGLLSRSHAFPLKRLTLMDLDARRLEIVANFCRRMAQRLNHPVVIDTTTDMEAALAADPGKATTYANLGLLQGLRGDAAKAEEAFTTAIQWCRRPGDTRQVLEVKCCAWRCVLLRRGMC